MLMSAPAGTTARVIGTRRRAGTTSRRSARIAVSTGFARGSAGRARTRSTVSAIPTASDAPRKLAPRGSGSHRSSQKASIQNASETATTWIQSTTRSRRRASGVSSSRTPGTRGSSSTGWSSHARASASGRARRRSSGGPARGSLIAAPYAERLRKGSGGGRSLSGGAGQRLVYLAIEPQAVLGQLGVAGVQQVRVEAAVRRA